MTQLAQHLTAFLREHLPRERHASVHTCDAYAYSFQLLVTFAAGRLSKRPCLLQIEDIDVPMILAFLEHIEGMLSNKARSRNARLAAVKSFFRYLEHRAPAVLDQALRVHAIPMKKIDEALVASLSRTEVQALLNAPDRRTSSGIRDRAMLHLAFAGGIRVSELVGLTLDQFDGGHRRVSISSAKDDESACCRSGRRPLLRSAPGSRLDPRVAKRRSS